MKYFIISYGCQMNKSDSERIAQALERKGYKAAQKINGTDLVVVNMCSVRQSAVDRIYGLSKNLKKLQTASCKPQTVLTGCILKKDRKKLAGCFDLVLDIKNFKNSLKTFQYHGLVRGTATEIKNINPKYSNNVSAFVPIMRGCNNFCAYCVVPYTRGREISRPAKEIICEVKKLVKQGSKEIWLLGQKVNSYSDIPFPQLLRKINDLPGKFWIRFTSSHPRDFSDELINVMAKCEKVTEYLNLPVQAGDNEILKKMNRPYTIKYYKNLVKKIREKIPGIALSTDVIVGFPGETKKQFENTVKLFKEIKYDMAYIAKYSPRAGTAAAKLKDNVSQKEKERREKVLTEILKKTALENNKKYIGKTIEVLILKHETSNMKHFCIGKTRTNKTVRFQAGEFPDFVKVKIADALAWGLKGKK